MQYYPQSLRLLCLKFCLKNLEETLCHKNVTTGFFELREDIVLPLSLSADLLELYEERVGIVDVGFLNIFRDARRTCLRKLDLSNTDVTNEILSDLCNHPLNELNISFCRRLTLGFVHAVNKTAKTLQVLNVDHLTSEEFCTDYSRTCAAPHPDEDAPIYIFNLPNLRALTLPDMLDHEDSITDIVCTILHPLRNLQHLDLSRCETWNVEFDGCLEDLAPTLKSLVLHNIHFPYIDEVFVNISHLTQLRHLDISSDAVTTYRDDASEKLRCLLTSLPHLESLDISGTNLAGTGFEAPPVAAGGDSSCPIPALAGRHLKFLGLLGCAHAPCERRNLPADHVTGNADWKQIACSVTTYMDRPSMLLSSLEFLYQLMRSEDVSSEAQTALCTAVVTAMERCPKDGSVQTSGSASLYFFAKREDNEARPNFSQKLTERMIRCLLHAINRFMGEKTLVLNSCITLCQLDLPADIQFEYEFTVKVLVALLLRPEVDDLVLRITAFLMNCLSCHVTGAEKSLIGDLGGIEALTSLISDRLQDENCDEVMTVCWSALWNVTDETCLNCERFMNKDGMALFLECLETFPDNDDLRRNMMGLMGNIAEVKQLRPQLMQPQFVEQFSNLLESTTDGIEVSYNAAGVLSHMLSDGAEAWVIGHPERSEVASRIVTAIERWDLLSSRNINYRSFHPILDLASRFDVPEAQYWAVWALCNLTKVYPDKYCPLLHRQGGFLLLEQITQHAMVREHVKTLARMVIAEHLLYETRQGQSCPLHVAH